MKGLFITMEGPDGAGKTTVINQLIPLLQKHALVDIISTREPGGSRIAEDIRKVILDVNNTEMDERTEAILYAAGRRQHLKDRILPNLEKGNIVFCDRFVDSSVAYQSYGRGLNKQDILDINAYATDNLEPDLTLYFSVDVEVGLARTKNRDDNNRMDQESLDFYKNVKRGYDDLSKEYSERIKVIDASDTYDNVQKKALSILEGFLNNEL